ncbi:hypothetical protein CFAM422_008439 [Trichoderma lentiforme]|uniref:HNH nuclease domain-containing protein n=1 Tax=Trichoderma lentiforme TaxID=1567552 RepID=A0A9P4XB05_9HYPO|nr:hypothetical protein CFAM422_008439 [Trichoderma lentiforme]
MAEPSDISDPVILADVTAFLAQGTESQKKQLCRFLRAQSSYRYSAPDAILPAEELAIKLGIIEELRKNEEHFSFQKPFHFSYIQLATLCLIPTETLQELLHPKQFLSSVLYPEDWLNILIRWKHPADSIEDGRRGLPVISSSSRDEREKCKLRDQRTCILTQAANPDVCRIMPSSVAESKAQIGALLTPAFLSILLGQSGLKIARILLNGAPDTFEQSWNMICLHPLVRLWWSECLFGLKCLGIDSNGEHSTVKIQFHWMPMNSVRPHQPVEPPYDKATSAMLESMASDVQEGYFHGLKSGQIFEIQLPSEEDAEKMKAALDVQWVAVRLAALSGAARSWEWGLGNDLYDDGDDHVAYGTSDVEDEE